MLFAYGQVVTTPGILDLMTYDEMVGLLRRHLRGDWGDMCRSDQRLNDRSVKDGTRILSSYDWGPGAEKTKVWIITEADRSVTTILRADEY